MITLVSKLALPRVTCFYKDLYWKILKVLPENTKFKVQIYNVWHYVHKLFSSSGPSVKNSASLGLTNSTYQGFLAFSCGSLPMLVKSWPSGQVRLPKRSNVFYTCKEMYYVMPLVVHQSVSSFYPLYISFTALRIFMRLG